MGTGIAEIKFFNGDNNDPVLQGLRCLLLLKGKIEVEGIGFRGQRLVDLRMGGPRGGFKTAVFIKPREARHLAEILFQKAGEAEAILNP